MILFRRQGDEGGDPPLVVAPGVAARPQRYVAQEWVHVSQAPVLEQSTEADRSEQLSSRTVGLRVFAVATPNGYHVMPGGLTRVDSMSNPRAGARRRLWQGQVQAADGEAAALRLAEVEEVHEADAGEVDQAVGGDRAGIDAEDADAVGVRPPGALKFAVPQDAIAFEVDLTLDKNRTKIASIQALVLKEKPKSQSYIPGRYVFGGRKREADANQEGNKERDRLLSRRNVSEANLTKMGLNAERNVLATWTRTPLDTIGGPWPDQGACLLRRPGGA